MYLLYISLESGFQEPQGQVLTRPYAPVNAYRSSALQSLFLLVSACCVSQELLQQHSDRQGGARMHSTASGPSTGQRTDLLQCVRLVRTKPLRATVTALALMQLVSRSCKLVH